MMKNYIVVTSTDNDFMCELIKWLNTAKCEKDSTLIRFGHMDYDPLEELSLRMAQIEGMTTRIFDLEQELIDLKEGMVRE